MSEAEVYVEACTHLRGPGGRKEGGREGRKEKRGKGGKNIAGNLLGGRKSAEFDTSTGEDVSSTAVSDTSATHYFSVRSGGLREGAPGRPSLSINLSLIGKVNK